MRPRSRRRSLLLIWLVGLVPWFGRATPAAAAIREDYRQFLLRGASWWS